MAIGIPAWGATDPVKPRALGLTKLRKIMIARTAFVNWPVLSALLWLEDPMLRSPWLSRVITTVFGHSVLLRTKSGLSFRAPLVGAFPAFEIFGLGSYESTDVRWSDVEYVIDCGAHVGVFSLWIAQRCPCRVIALEPSPVTYGLLRVNTAAWRSRIILRRAAVAGSSGVRPLFGAGGSDQASLMSRVDNRGRFDVRTVGLDDLIRSSGFPRVDLLKLDVEGAETEVLAGAPLEALEKVRVAIVECHPNLGADSNVVIETLRRAGMAVRWSPHMIGETLLVVATRKGDSEGV